MLLEANYPSRSTEIEFRFIITKDIGTTLKTDRGKMWNLYKLRQVRNINKCSTSTPDQRNKSFAN